MKLVTFNVNGIRARLHQLQRLIDEHKPDVIGLQEIKVFDPEFPVDAITDMGYHVSYHGQKTHYGVALMSLEKPLSIQKGFSSDNEDSQRRLIIGKYPMSDGRTITVINGYFPQGESRNHETKFPAKKQFYRDLQSHLNTQCSSDEPLAVMGDFNISHTDDDIGIGADNAKRWLRTGKCSFLPEEREWFDTLLSWGLRDCFRELVNGNEECYSWFDYRSKGFDREPRRGLRIDGILATDTLFSQCSSTTIDYSIRAMDKPSDHAPVIAQYSL